jgi:DNA polymerase IV (DinB-like DNA polymerase)
MRIIGHLDMDAFFAAVEERDHEWLQGKPIVVGADPKDGKGRGVVSTANYKAREYGIHSAMPISRAWELSETAKKKGFEPAVFLFTDFHAYGTTSERIMEIIRGFSPKIEPASIDEAYFEINTNSWKEAEDKARIIKNEIVKKERLTCSIGIGPNKLIAKIASDIQKPNGLTVVSDAEKESFLEPMPIRKIPGIGPKTEALFKKMNVSTVGDLKKFTESKLIELMGKWGSELYQKVRGVDDSPIEEFYESKSIGEQETFEEDTRDPLILIGKIREMSNRIVRHMTDEEFSGFKTIVITVRFADFETRTRSHTISAPTPSQETLNFEALKLFMPFLDRRENPRDKNIRLVGVRIEKLQKAG